MELCPKRKRRPISFATLAPFPYNHCYTAIGIKLCSYNRPLSLFYSTLCMCGYMCVSVKMEKYFVTSRTIRFITRAIDLAALWNFLTFGPYTSRVDTIYAIYIGSSNASKWVVLISQVFFWGERGSKRACDQCKRDSLELVQSAAKSCTFELIGFS